jgi:hypothetical protein
MNEKEQKAKKTMLKMSSKFWKTLLIVLSVLLIFAGPTYMVYVLINILEINYFISMGSGFAFFIVGLVLLLYLIKKGIIT